MGWIACRSSSSFQPASCDPVQSPYARLMVGAPCLAISARSSAVRLAVVLSESISTASRVVLSVGTGASLRMAPTDPARASIAATVRAMTVFRQAELDYLAGGRQLGRIATVGADGTPHVVPVA